jgi:outer membrane lipoprotein-sorting protein
MSKRIIWYAVVLAIGVSFLLAGCSKGNAPAGGSLSSGQPTASSSSSQPSAQGQTGGQTLTNLIALAKQGRDMSFDFNLTRANGKQMSGTMWRHPGMLKIATTVNGVDTIYILSYSDNSMISYQPSTKTGNKAALPSASDEDMSTYLQDIDPNTAQNLGTQAVNGVNCYGIQFVSSKQQNATIKIWLSQDQNVPIQLLRTNTNGSTLMINFSNYTIGPLPSNTFSVPSDIQITTNSSGQ